VTSHSLRAHLLLAGDEVTAADYRDTVAEPDLVAIHTPLALGTLTIQGTLSDVAGWLANASVEVSRLALARSVVEDAEDRMVHAGTPDEVSRVLERMLSEP